MACEVGPQGQVVVDAGAGSLQAKSRNQEVGVLQPVVNLGHPGMSSPILPLSRTAGVLQSAVNRIHHHQLPQFQKELEYSSQSAQSGSSKNVITKFVTLSRTAGVLQPAVNRIHHHQLPQFQKELEYSSQSAQSGTSKKVITNSATVSKTAGVSPVSCQPGTTKNAITNCQCSKKVKLGHPKTIITNCKVLRFLELQLNIASRMSGMADWNPCGILCHVAELIWYDLTPERR